MILSAQSFFGARGMPSTAQFIVGMPLAGTRGFAASFADIGHPFLSDEFVMQVADRRHEKLPEPQNPNPSPFVSLPGKMRAEITALAQGEFQSLTGPGNPFGTYPDGKGNLIYPKEAKDEIVKYLSHGRVVKYPLWDLLVIAYPREGRISELQILFPDSLDMQSESSVQLDHSPFFASPGSSTTIFHYPENNNPTQYEMPGALLRWIEAMRDFGHDIRMTSTTSELMEALQTLEPKIVMVSGAEAQIAAIQESYAAIKRFDPSIMTILGGVAAIPSFARFFDIVWRGEGAFFMIVLNFLQQLLQEGNVKKVEAVEWSDLIEGYEQLLSRASQSVRDQLTRQGLKYYPPLFEPAIAQQIISLSARRFVNLPDQTLNFDIPVGLGFDGKPRLFIRSTDGQINAEAALGSTQEKYAEERRGWRQQHGSDYPLPYSLFRRAASPIPLGEELDALYLRYSWHTRLYSQYGCLPNPDKRCRFCAIQMPAGGRQHTVGQIIKMMMCAVVNGETSLTLSDDQFFQNHEWLKELIDRIEELGLQNHIRFSDGIFTRADTIVPFWAEIKKLREMFGLSVGIGAETFLAELAGPKGFGKSNNGDRYLRNLIEGLNLLADDPQNSTDSINIIRAGIGWSPLEIARSALAELEITGDLKRYGYEPEFNYASQQMPLYGDRQTANLSGYPDAQPGKISAENGKDITLGEVEGEFSTFAMSQEGGSLFAEGIFQPEKFFFPEPIEHAIYLGLGSPSQTYESLESAAKYSYSLGEQERRELQSFLREKRSIFLKGRKRRPTQDLGDIPPHHQDINVRGVLRKINGQPPNGEEIIRAYCFGMSTQRKSAFIEGPIARLLADRDAQVVIDSMDQIEHLYNLLRVDAIGIEEAAQRIIVSDTHAARKIIILATHDDEFRSFAQRLTFNRLVPKELTLIDATTFAVNSASLGEDMVGIFLGSTSSVVGTQKYAFSLGELLKQLAQMERRLPAIQLIGKLEKNQGSRDAILKTIAELRGSG